MYIARECCQAAEAHVRLSHVDLVQILLVISQEARRRPHCVHCVHCIHCVDCLNCVMLTTAVMLRKVLSRLVFFSISPNISFIFVSPNGMGSKLAQGELLPEPLFLHVLPHETRLFSLRAQGCMHTTRGAFFPGLLAYATRFHPALLLRGEATC